MAVPISTEIGSQKDDGDIIFNTSPHIPTTMLPDISSNATNLVTSPDITTSITTTAEGSKCERCLKHRSHKKTLKRKLGRLKEHVAKLKIELEEQKSKQLVSCK